MKAGAWRVAKDEAERVGSASPAARAGPRIIDISPRISPAISVWPGDVPYTSKKTARLRDGGGIDLGDMHTTYHVGAHTDAPQHYALGGAAVADVPLDAYYGPCEVVEVRVERGARFDWDNLVQKPSPTTPRVLFKTGTFPDPRKWNNDFAAPEPALIDRLGKAGCKLVGFDAPSTDLFASKGLPSHQMLAKHRMMNLEGLVLAAVRPGTYTLIAFPLPLEDADASPVRAVLVSEPG